METPELRYTIISCKCVLLAQVKTQKKRKMYNYKTTECAMNREWVLNEVGNEQTGVEWRDMCAHLGGDVESGCFVPTGDSIKRDWRIVISYSRGNVETTVTRRWAPLVCPYITLQDKILKLNPSLRTRLKLGHLSNMETFLSPRTVLCTPINLNNFFCRIQ